MEFSPETPLEAKFLFLKISSRLIFLVPVCENNEREERIISKEINCFIRRFLLILLTIETYLIFGAKGKNYQGIS
jgi:hypothetical protein